VNFRGYRARIVAEYTKTALELPTEFTLAEVKSPEYLAKFPLGQSPSLEADNINLTESVAIAFYVASLKDSALNGTTKEETAEVLQYAFYSESTLVPTILAWTYTIWGRTPYNAQTEKTQVASIESCLAHLDTLLKDKTFLVNHRITLADIVIGSALVLVYKQFATLETRQQYKNVTRYFTTLVNQPEFKAVIGEVTLCETRAKYEKPKAAPKAVPKPAAKPLAEDQDLDEAQLEKAKKPKSKLDLLPPSSFNLEDWKRFYSNNDTKPDAMNYFWQHFDPQGYSLWKVDYKYNDELTKVFMTSNLVGGFFNRLEAARKYLFAVLLVLGVDNKNSISGIFAVRSTELPEEVTECPDYDSYVFTKLDSSDAKTRELVSDYFAWEGPTFTEPVAVGKAFK
jgi:elongation factor 1-gamma